VKRFLVPLVLAVALVVPAQAAAKSRHYVGAVSPSGSISFSVVQKKHSKQKSVNGFTFSGVPVNCADGPTTTHGNVTFPVKLHKNGSFNISASSSVTGASLQVSGNLAAGTIHVSGDVPIDPSGTGSNCDSGILSWTAQRG
jgi:opacity protein-like surface antigen